MVLGGGAGRILILTLVWCKTKGVLATLRKKGLEERARPAQPDTQKQHRKTRQYTLIIGTLDPLSFGQAQCFPQVGQIW